MHSTQSRPPMRCKWYYILLVVFGFLFLVIWTALLASLIKDKAIPMLLRARKRYNIDSFGLPIETYKKLIPGMLYEPFDEDAFSRASDVDVPMFKLGDLLSRWNPDDVSVRRWSESLAHPSKGKSVPRFDYSLEGHRKVAAIFREAELPFIVYNVAEVEDAIKNAFTIDRLIDNFGTDLIDVDESVNYNHFTYYKEKKAASKAYPKWTPPQKPVKMRFEDFLYLSEDAENYDLIKENKTLHYYTISASQGYQLNWLRSALPIFSRKKSFFIVDPSGFKGINCRFGQKGVVATAHYDGGRNFIAMLRGRKRYILLPPKECKNLHLLPRDHPSGRHSELDWSDVDDLSRRPEIWNADATEVILGPGDVLYIPGYWFHYIISQDASIQCNARSGDSIIGRDYISDCGFYDEENEPNKADHHPKKKPRLHRVSNKKGSHDFD